MTHISLEELVSRVDEIPVFPQIITNIIHKIEDPEAGASEVEAEIKKDQGLTTKILRLANSSYYGSRRNIITVADAVVLLGFQAVKSMVFATSVGEVFSRELPGYALGKEELWRQSQISAITCRVLAKKIKYKTPDQAYTAGLLRDIGKVILDHYMSEQYDLVVQMANDSERSFLEVEQEILGFHHGEVGARIAEKWKLPEDLVEAIASHHNPSEAVINPKMTSMVHVADGIVMMMGLHLGIDGMSYPFSESAMTQLNLDEQLISEIMSEVADIISDEGIFIN